MACLLLLAAVGRPGVLRGDIPRSHQAWSTDEGLPDNSIHQVFQSRDGYLWLATEGGVARFDGSTFRIFRHDTDPAFSSNDVSAIAQDASGALWFGTADGLVQRRGSALRHFSERDGLPSSTVSSLAAAGDGSVLVLTPRGLVRFDGATFKPLSAFNGVILSLQSAQDGTVWLMTTEGVDRYDRGTITRQSLRSADSANSRDDESILGLQFGPAGAVWTRSIGSVTVKLPDFERVLHTGRELPRGHITALCVDRHGTGWIGTNHGLFSLDPVPKAPVKTVDAMHAESILSIMEDREGNLWIGTETSGLHTLRPRKFRIEPASAGESVTAGTADSGGVLWFGTREDGVRRIRNGIAEQPVPLASLTSPVVLSMARGDQGDVWVGTPDGLNEIAGKRVKQYTSSNGLPDDFVRSVLVDSRGIVWAGTRRGLARIEGGKISTLTQTEGLGSDSIGPLLESKQTSNERSSSLPVSDVWVGTSTGLSHIRVGRIQNFSPYQDKARDVVSAMAEGEDGSLWVGFHGEGLSRFAEGRFTPIRSSALPSEITSLIVDHQGYLWLRGVRGIYHVSLAELRACADGRKKCLLSVAEYSVADGMPSDAAPVQGMASVWQAPDGNLWFATPKGIAVADPSHLPINATPPPVAIQRFVVDESDVTPDPGDTQIGPGHNRYTFDYVALSYTLPAKNRYRYMLEGFDRNWIDAGTARTASYTSLPPGEYRFRVLARNNDGVWNETGAELRFHILPPIYRRLWFYILALIAVAGLAVTVFRLRLRALQRRFALVLNERNRMAREIHDTLAQDFVSVSLQLDIASQMLRARNVEQAASQLEGTRKLVKDALEAARQSIWNLRANAAEDSLPTRLSALVKRYAETDHAPHLKIGGAYRQLTVALEDDVFRITQESLANAYRHSRATDILVQLHYDPNVLKLNVRDNGQGFVPAIAQGLDGHYGLRGMQERASSIGATLTIVSNLEEGTTVTLVVPLAGREDK